MTTPPMRSREHFMSEQGGVVRDPVQLEDPARCRSGTGGTWQGRPSPNCDGTLGQISKGQAQCQKCGLAHGFIVVKGQIRYGVLL
jgi:hypothetical protein